MKAHLRTAANGLWFVSCLPGAVSFQRALRDVSSTQARILRQILQRNKATEFGRRHDFAAIRSVAEFQKRVPLSTYDDYQQMISRTAQGNAGVLTHGPVLLLEPTSGSAAPTKLVPYTAELKAEFQRAIAPWIVDLYRHEPSLFAGQAYWSLSPVSRTRERTPGGIPIGFEDDSEYLGGIQRWLVRHIMAVPPCVRLIEDMESFRYVTLLFLLRSGSLALISVWNPTFLTLLVQPLRAWRRRLADDIARGTLSPPGEVSSALRAEITAFNRPDPRRATEIEAAFDNQSDAGNIHARLWPHLRLISCWTDASAAMYAAPLAKLFPHARLQGKGLVATEGLVSFPLAHRDGALLAVGSHFYEFLPTQGGAARLAHELESGKSYSVILTTSGGLYRYQLHDIVEVIGHLGDCPQLRFLGKEAHVSDRFGEKINERHLQRALDFLVARLRIKPSFLMVACETENDRPAYTLFIEAPGESDEPLQALGDRLEAALQENFHYRYCRDLGQLDPLRVFRIKRGALESFVSRCQQHGQRAGRIKPLLLHRLDGWVGAFEGVYLNTRTKHQPEELTA